MLKKGAIFVYKSTKGHSKTHYNYLEALAEVLKKDQQEDYKLLLANVEFEKVYYTYSSCC